MTVGNRRHLRGCNNTNGKVEEAVGYTSEDFRLDVVARYINLGANDLWVLQNNSNTRLDEITDEGVLIRKRSVSRFPSLDKVVLLKKGNDPRARL